jgi:hypothetical protein
MMKVTANPNTTPAASPPAATVTKLMAACVALNAPVRLAATANRNNTRPEASLTRLSPSSNTVRRCGRRTFCNTALAATASGGETMAPSAKQAAQGSDGIT